MSEPVHLLNDPIVVNGDMSGNINSSPTNLNECVSYSIQAVMTGSPTGTIELQASNDNVKSSAEAPVNWTTITESEADITAAGTYMVNVELPSYSWVRLVYTRTGGNGSMNARINAKRR